VAVVDFSSARNEIEAPSLFGENVNVSVVIPTLNEAENLPHVLPRIPTWVDEIIVVDGRSTDNTVEVARRLIPNVVIVEEKRPGKGAALRAGFQASRGDIIIALDADGSADPAEMPLFVGALLSGADFVKGSRFQQGGGTRDMEWYRRLGNWGLLELVKLRFGGRFTDLCYGYNAFWRDILPLIDIDNDDGFEIETSMNIQVMRAGLNVFEVPSTEAPRINGVSNLRSIPDGLRVLSTIIRLGLRRSNLPKKPANDQRHYRRRPTAVEAIEATLTSNWAEKSRG
jgi:glycosyltransferase involved in cell wall biosynthesis